MYKPPEPTPLPQPEADTLGQQYENAQQYNQWQQSDYNELQSPWPPNEYQRQQQEALERKASSAATISLICGIIGNVVFWPVFGLLAIFQGRKARSLGYAGGKAIAGIVLGVIAIAWGLVFTLMVFRLAPGVTPDFSQLFPFP